MSNGLKNFGRDDEDDNQNDNDGSQSKSLFAHVYSAPNGRYKSTDDWDSSTKEVQLAYDLASPNGMVRDVFEAFSGAGDREDTFTQFVISLAEYLHFNGLHQHFGASDLESAIEDDDAVSSPEGILQDFLGVEGRDIAYIMRKDEELAVDVIQQFEEAGGDIEAVTEQARSDEQAEAEEEE